MEWERNGRGWRLSDAEDEYEIVPCKLHKVNRFTVWKNGAIWLATCETFHAADRAVATEVCNSNFYSNKPANRESNETRQRKRVSDILELKRKEARERAKRDRTVKLYRW